MKWPVLLNALSGVWAVIWVNATVLVLVESRYPRRKTLTLLSVVSLFVMLLMLWTYRDFGSAGGGLLSLLTHTLPMLVFFFLISKYRDARPVFAYFFVDCITNEIVFLTNVLNAYWTPETNFINFFGRLALYPLVFWLFWRKVREPFQYVLRGTARGWGAFAFLALAYHVTAILLFNFPSAITDRPAELPAMLLFLLLTPLTFWRLFDALRQQRELHEAREREQLLDIQTEALERRMEQTALADKRLSVQRHDLRHRFRALHAMLERGEVADALAYVDASAEALSETKPRRWCENAVLDAMFAAYFGMAEAEGVRVEASLDVPEKLGVSAAELSTVFANALENALQAVRPLPEERRVIRCECIRRPQFMFSVSNPYEGTVRFDDEGRPVALEKGHGFGTASIAAYCEKHGAFCDYAAENGWFTLRMVQP